MKKISLWDLTAATSLIGFVTTGMWAHLDALQPTSYILCTLFFVGSWWAFRKLNTEISIPIENSNPTQKRNYLFLCAALLLPLLAHLLWTWNWEFPFAGDHDHHLVATSTAARFVTDYWYWVLAFAIALFAGLKFSKFSWWPLPVLIFIFASGFFAEIPFHYFERYPAATYFLQVPLYKWAVAMDWKSLLNADRLTNFLAPVCWLLIFRPYLFGQKVSFGWLAMALFILTQKEFIFYFNSDYLESWALILTLLAIESLFDKRHPAWVPMILMGVACTHKDTAAIAFLVLGVGAVYKSRKDSKEIARTIAVSALSFLPFIIYYFARKNAGVWRKMELATFSEAFSQSRLELYFFRITDQFHISGLILIAALLGGALIFTFKKNESRILALAISAGGLAQFLLFFMDRISMAYTGYPRLHLVGWIMLLSPLFLIKTMPTKRWQNLLIFSFILLTQAPSAFSYIQQLKRPSYMQNFTEDYGFAFYYPIRELIEKAQDQKWLPPGQNMILLVPSPSTSVHALPLAYPDLFKQYAWGMAPAETQENLCSCQPGIAVLVPNPQKMNLNVQFPSVPYDIQINRIDSRCFEQLKKTCTHCVSVDDPQTASTSYGYLCMGTQP